MSLNDKQQAFIGRLLSLAKDGHEDRGALADLRSGLGKTPGKMARVHQYVAPYLDDTRYNDRWYYLVATLFGSFPEQRNDCSLGKAFSPLQHNSDSMEARFIALLNAHADDLDDHLRHTISLLKTHDQPLSWYRLLEDLVYWGHPSGNVQLRWARDFYGTKYKEPDDENDADTNNTQEEGE